MLSFLKKLSPDFIKTIARKTRASLYTWSDSIKPYLTSRTYSGFTLYYTKGAGLVNRIRFGNPNKTYEPELVSPIVEELQKYDAPVFLDIGTNIGLISLAILQKVPNVTIFGFEPSPIAYKSFATTIFANKLEQKVKLFNEALDAKPGSITFFVHDDQDSSGDGMIDTQRAESKSTGITVKSNTLDIWHKEDNVPKVNVIKIDIEGAELFALQGATEFLKQYKPLVFLEISKENLKVYPHKEKEVLAFFEANGYALFDLHGSPVTQQNISTITETEDTFLAKPNA